MIPTMRQAPPDSVEALDEADEQMTGEAVALEVRPAPFVLRAGGAIIDFLAEAVLFVLILLGTAWAASTAGSEEAVYAALAIVSFVLAFVVAPATVETISRGKSLGKLAVGARIVRDDGGAIGVRHAAIRSLSGLFEIVATLGGGAALFGLLTPRTKRMGDLLAGTYAQYERISRVPAPAFGVPAPLASWAMIADVTRLPDQLARRIAQFLSNTARLDPARRSWIARELAREAVAYVSPVPAADPELFLAALTVVRRDRETRALDLERRRLARLEPALQRRPHGFPVRG